MNTKMPLIAALGLMLAGAPLIAAQAQDTGPGTGSTATNGKDTTKPAHHAKKHKHMMKSAKAKTEGSTSTGTSGEQAPAK